MVVADRRHARGAGPAAPRPGGLRRAGTRRPDATQASLRRSSCSPSKVPLTPSRPLSGRSTCANPSTCSARSRYPPTAPSPWRGPPCAARHRRGPPPWSRGCARCCRSGQQGRSHRSGCGSIRRYSAEVGTALVMPPCRQTRIALANLAFPRLPGRRRWQRPGARLPSSGCGPRCRAGLLPGVLRAGLPGPRRPGAAGGRRTGSKPRSCPGRGGGRGGPGSPLSSAPERFVDGRLRITALVIGPDGSRARLAGQGAARPDRGPPVRARRRTRGLHRRRPGFGVVICHEGWRYPETVREAVRTGAQLVLHPHFSPAEPGGFRPDAYAEPGNSFHEAAVLCRAAENTAWFATVNCAGAGAPTTSAIARPDGTLLAFQPHGVAGPAGRRPRPRATPPANWPSGCGIVAAGRGNRLRRHASRLRRNPAGGGGHPRHLLDHGRPRGGRGPHPAGRAAGALQAPVPSPVAQLAAEQGIEVLRPARAGDPGLARPGWPNWPRDCCPVVAYGGLIPQRLLELPSHGWVNVHFSLLPRWRGAAPVQHAILAGDEVTGVTVFELVAALDAGPGAGHRGVPARGGRDGGGGTRGTATTRRSPCSSRPSTGSPPAPSPHTPSQRRA